MLLNIERISYNNKLQYFLQYYYIFLHGFPLFAQIIVVNFVLILLLINPCDGQLISDNLIFEETGHFLHSQNGAFISSVIVITLNESTYISKILGGQ